MMGIERLQILITGQVQGVGFRPQVYHIARLLNLSGWVQNNPLGVLIEIQGTSTTDFLQQLRSSLPTLARIDNIQTNKIDPLDHESSFKIIHSDPGPSHTMISPDTSICNACLHELFDPLSRYYRYPFLNCTQCGPRLTITRTLPYDRYQTTMNQFPLCLECQNDYQDPTNRRYHAQPTACARCGPECSATIAAMTQAIQQGQIVAIKGLGGYQLICDAKNEHTVFTLRQRKNRDAKPFALMLANVLSAKHIVELNEHEEQLLKSPARPIVLLKHYGEPFAQWIAPHLSHLGIMLPATPLHFLLFHALAGYPKGYDWLDQALPHVLVVTSANLAGNPLLIDDETAYQDLASIADLFVSYNRQIITRMDDSVMQLIHHTPVFIRRARGYVPERIKLPYPMPSTLALGGHLKNTFCITRGDEAFVSQHIGSLTNKLTIEFFHESLTHWLHLLDIHIERIACDLHPDFYTTHLAHEYHLDVIPVQHHHAHLAAVAAEHHLIKPALGLALDGYGYGVDGDAWGGELLLFDSSRFQRLGSLLPLPQPGGDIATREPWRMAAGILHLLNRNQQIIERFSNEPQAHLLAHVFNTKQRMPLTSSCGRLFDAASALLGINQRSSYEGQAAQQLESLVTELEVLSNGWYVEGNHLSFLPTLTHLLDMPPIQGANLFHGTLIAGLTEWVVSIANQQLINVIVLSGGCFLNKVLSEGLSNSLTQHGLTVYLPQRLPPNDGGLSLGQAFIAGSINVSSNSSPSH